MGNNIRYKSEKSGFFARPSLVEPSDFELCRKLEHGPTIESLAHPNRLLPRISTPFLGQWVLQQRIVHASPTTRNVGFRFQQLLFPPWQRLDTSRSRRHWQRGTGSPSRSRGSTHGQQSDNQQNHLERVHERQFPLVGRYRVGK